MCEILLKHLRRSYIQSVIYEASFNIQGGLLQDAGKLEFCRWKPVCPVANIRYEVAPRWRSQFGAVGVVAKGRRRRLCD